MRIFVQGEDIKGVQMIDVESETNVRDIVNLIVGFGLPTLEEGEEYVVLLEDESEPLTEGSGFPFDSKGEARIHCHRCKQIKVSCYYNNEVKFEHFPPSATIRKVKKWFTSDKGFNIPEADAAELVLQLTGTKIQPEPDTHIGSLVKHPICSLSFDLVPKDRPQG